MIPQGAARRMRFPVATPDGRRHADPETLSAALDDVLSVGDSVVLKGSDGERYEVTVVGPRTVVRRGLPLPRGIRWDRGKCPRLCDEREVA